MRNIKMDEKFLLSSVFCYLFSKKMLTNNFYMYSLKILGEITRDIIMFPFWWYSRGFFQVLKGLINFLKYREKGLALRVWVKNFWKPMYGQHDWQGRLISIFMRLVQIIFRSIVMVFWLIVASLLLVAWVIIPPIIVYEIFFQLI